MGLIDPETALAEDQGKSIFWSVIQSDGEIALLPNEADSYLQAQSEVVKYIEEVRNDIAKSRGNDNMKVEVIRTFDRSDSSKLNSILENDLPELGRFIEFMFYFNDKKVDPYTYDFIAGASEFVQLSNAQRV